jgi:hypothetical protein
MVGLLVLEPRLVLKLLYLCQLLLGLLEKQHLLLLCELLLLLQRCLLLLLLLLVLLLLLHHLALFES